MTREQNLRRFGDRATMDIETYLTGVVPSEIGDNSPMEALKAQAIAARTYAVSKVLAGYSLDDTANCQAFRCERMSSPNSQKAVVETTGQVLMYCGQIVQAYFSSSNGGTTHRSGDVWNRHYPYYLNRVDPWDAAARAESPEIKISHGIGMSQVGAKYAARQGISHEEILAFYYQESYIVDSYGSEVEKGDGTLPETVKASALISEFKRMLGWKYEWGAAREGCVDCSGAFAYAYKRLGSTMYHGSNTMWRRYTTAKGRRGDIPLVPGMAVFKWQAKGGPDAEGDYFHVGLYVGNGQVVEARGTKDGCVQSPIGDWSHIAQLKYTDYDVTEGSETAIEHKARVTTASGTLNLRGSPKTGKVLARIPQGEMIDIYQWDSSPGWAYVGYNGTAGYASQEFLTRLSDTAAGLGPGLWIPLESREQAATYLGMLQSLALAEIKDGKDS